MTSSHNSASNGITPESPRNGLPTARHGATPGKYCYPRGCTPREAVALGLLVDITEVAREVTHVRYPVLIHRWAYDEHILPGTGGDVRAISGRLRTLLRRMQASLRPRWVKYPEDIHGTFFSIIGARLTVQGRPMNIHDGFYALVITEPY
jgi:hypothetical protein